MALLYEKKWEHAKGLPYAERALAINEKVRGPKHLATAMGMNSLVRLHAGLGNHEKAEEFYELARQNELASQENRRLVERALGDLRRGETDTEDFYS